MVRPININSLVISCFTLFIRFSWILPVHCCEECDNVHYTNSWAVHIENGNKEVADEIAKRHGFVNLGQVGSLPGYYHFIHNSNKARRKRRALDKTVLLLSEEKVKWVEQQHVLERDKRSTVIPDFVGLSHPNGIVIQDPLYKDQWYLNNVGQSSGPPNLDINVLPVWAKGITGTGVVVAILDDGLDHTHPDLVKNYDARASYDFNDYDIDPMPRTKDPNNCHGTKCAGEVAAEADNGICGVGVAFNSSIGGIRMLDGNTTDTIEGSALSYHNNYIHIYSCAWGPKDDGKRFGRPGTLASKALELGTKEGRGGLGSIFVWATGNGGLTDDDCNCDGYTTSIYTVSIGAISDHGLSTYYTESCASTLAVTYSGGSHREKKENKIVTTTLNHKCTEEFKGTSSAAPLAAGMIALMLEANPKLTWRDVQHIIVETSLMTSPLDEGWRRNGAGKWFNQKFGFGRMDASQMIDRASQWDNVPEQRKCWGERNEGPWNIPESGSLLVASNVTACKSTALEVRSLEHLQLVISLKHRHRGHLSIELISPAGTRSQILKTRRNDHSSKGLKACLDMHCIGVANRIENAQSMIGRPGQSVNVHSSERTCEANAAGENSSFIFTDWIFMSVHFWGEDPRGAWTLVVTDNSNNNRRHYFAKMHHGDFEDATEALQEETMTSNEDYQRPSEHEGVLEKNQEGGFKNAEDFERDVFYDKSFQNNPKGNKYSRENQVKEKSLRKKKPKKKHSNKKHKHHKKEKHKHKSNHKHKHPTHRHKIKAMQSPVNDDSISPPTLFGRPLNMLTESGAFKTDQGKMPVDLNGGNTLNSAGQFTSAQFNAAQSSNNCPYQQFAELAMAENATALSDKETNLARLGVAEQSNLPAAVASSPSPAAFPTQPHFMAPQQPLPFKSSTGVPPEQHLSPTYRNSLETNNNTNDSMSSHHELVEGLVKTVLTELFAALRIERMQNRSEESFSGKLTRMEQLLSSNGKEQEKEPVSSSLLKAWNKEKGVRKINTLLDILDKNKNVSRTNNGTSKANEVVSDVLKVLRDVMSADKSDEKLKSFKTKVQKIIEDHSNETRNLTQKLFRDLDPSQGKDQTGKTLSDAMTLISRIFRGQAKKKKVKGHGFDRLPDGLSRLINLPGNIGLYLGGPQGSIILPYTAGQDLISEVKPRTESLVHSWDNGSHVETVKIEHTKFDPIKIETLDDRKVSDNVTDGNLTKTVDSNATDHKLKENDTKTDRKDKNFEEQKSKDDAKEIKQKQEKEGQTDEILVKLKEEQNKVKERDNGKKKNHRKTYAENETESNEDCREDETRKGCAKSEVEGDAKGHGKDDEQIDVTVLFDSGNEEKPTSPTKKSPPAGKNVNNFAYQPQFSRVNIDEYTVEQPTTKLSHRKTTISNNFGPTTKNVQSDGSKVITFDVDNKVPANHENYEDYTSPDDDASRSKGDIPEDDYENSSEGDNESSGYVYDMDMSNPPLPFISMPVPGQQGENMVNSFADSFALSPAFDIINGIEQDPLVADGKDLFETENFKHEWKRAVADLNTPTESLIDRSMRSVLIRDKNQRAFASLENKEFFSDQNRLQRYSRADQGQGYRYLGAEKSDMLPFTKHHRSRRSTSSPLMYEKTTSDYTDSENSIPTPSRSVRSTTEYMEKHDRIDSIGLEDALSSYSFSMTGDTTAHGERRSAFDENTYEKMESVLPMTEETIKHRDRRSLSDDKATDTFFIASETNGHQTRRSSSNENANDMITPTASLNMKRNAVGQMNHHNQRPVSVIEDTFLFRRKREKIEDDFAEGSDEDDENDEMTDSLQTTSDTTKHRRRQSVSDEDTTNASTAIEVTRHRRRRSAPDENTEGMITPIAGLSVKRNAVNEAKHRKRRSMSNTDNASLLRQKREEVEDDFGGGNDEDDENDEGPHVVKRSAIFSELRPSKTPDVVSEDPSDTEEFSRKSKRFIEMEESANRTVNEIDEALRSLGHDKYARSVPDLDSAEEAERRANVRRTSSLEGVLRKKLLSMNRQSKSVLKLLQRVHKDISTGNAQDLRNLQTQMIEMEEEQNQQKAEVQSRKPRKVKALSIKKKKVKMKSATPKPKNKTLRNTEEPNIDKLEQESSEFKDDPDAYLKYGAGNSGLLESWTLIFYGT